LKFASIMAYVFKASLCFSILISRSIVAFKSVNLLPRGKTFVMEYRMRSLLLGGGCPTPDWGPAPGKVAAVTPGKGDPPELGAATVEVWTGVGEAAADPGAGELPVLDEAAGVDVEEFLASLGRSGKKQTITFISLAPPPKHSSPVPPTGMISDVAFVGSIIFSVFFPRSKLTPASQKVSEQDVVFSALVLTDTGSVVTCIAKSVALTTSTESFIQ